MTCKHTDDGYHMEKDSDEQVPRSAISYHQAQKVPKGQQLGTTSANGSWLVHHFQVLYFGRLMYMECGSVL